MKILKLAIIATLGIGIYQLGMMVYARQVGICLTLGVIQYVRAYVITFLILLLIYGGVYYGRLYKHRNISG